MRKLLILALCVLTGIASATDYFYSTGNGFWTNIALWGGAAYPGQNSATDRAIFTNKLAFNVAEGQTLTLSDVLFRNPVSTITFGVTNATLTLTNSLWVGDTATGTVTLGSASWNGTVVITNSAMTGSLMIGSTNGLGTFILNGGMLLCNKIISTNVGIGYSNSMFVTIASGSTLITTNAPGVTVADIRLRTGSPNFNCSGTWQMQGGNYKFTNSLGSAGYLYAGTGGTNIINAGTFVDLGLMGFSFLGNNGKNLIQNGAIVTNGSSISGGSVNSNLLQISNGSWLSASNSSTSFSAGGVSNGVVVDNSTLLMGACSFGQNSAANGTGTGGSCWLVLTNGAYVSAGTFAFGSQISFTQYGINYCRGFVSGLGNNSTPSTLKLGGAFGVGTAQSSCSNIFIVGAGGVVTGETTVAVGTTGTNIANQLIINNGGQVFASGAISVGNGTAPSSNNIVSVGQGSVLAGGNMSCGTASAITNDRGTYEYMLTPTLTPGTFGNISINNGTISYCGGNVAEVLCSQSGKVLDYTAKMSFGGTNAFQLNNATNVNSGEAYTFGPSTPFNWWALRLISGGYWRGGNAIFSSGSALVVSNGINTIATNVIMQAGSSLVIDVGGAATSQLNITGQTANFSNATLAVSLRNAPTPGATNIIITSQYVPINFYPATASAAYAGTTYNFTVGSNATNIFLVAQSTSTNIKNLAIGTNKITNVFLGSRQIKTIRIGTNTVWSN